MSVLCQTFWFCSIIVAASSTTLYLVNDSYGVPPDTFGTLNNIFSFDTNTKHLEVFEPMPKATVTIDDVAILCNDIYYAYESIPSNAKISFIAFDPNNAKQASTYSASQKYPAFECNALLCLDSSSSSGDVNLLMVNTIETAAFQSYAVLELAHLDKSNGNLVTDVIGYLPQKYSYGYGNTFQFNADGSLLWATPVDESGRENSVLLIVDTENANITETYTFAHDAGIVYFALPTTFANGSFKAAIVPTSNYGVDFATVTIDESSNTLSVHREIVDANLYGDDMPCLAVCDGVGYIITERTGTVVEFDINTGKQINEYDVATNKQYLEMGSLAC